MFLKSDPSKKPVPFKHRELQGNTERCIEK
jgi:hypothetical protein